MKEEKYEEVKAWLLKKFDDDEMDFESYVYDRASQCDLMDDIIKWIHQYNKMKNKQHKQKPDELLNNN